MKTKFIITLSASLMVFITFCDSLYAQSRSTPAHFKAGDAALGKLLAETLHKQTQGKDVHVCLVSATFARFNIDSNGHVIKLSFSENKGTPSAFREILTAIIMATDGAWAPATLNGKAVDSKPFILPFVYSMEAGCDSRGIRTKDETATALLNILNVEDAQNKSSALDCILLPPMFISSQN